MFSHFLAIVSVHFRGIGGGQPQLLSRYRLALVRIIHLSTDLGISESYQYCDLDKVWTN